MKNKAKFIKIMKIQPEETWARGGEETEGWDETRFCSLIWVLHILGTDKFHQTFRDISSWKLAFDANDKASSMQEAQQNIIDVLDDLPIIR